MGFRIKALTTTALLTAVQTVLLILASSVPSGRLALTAAAGLGAVLAMLHYGPFWALGSFAASAALGLLLSPLKGCALLYTAFLGWYPIAKSFFERPRSRFVEWLLKLLVFNAAFAAIWFLIRAFLPEAGLTALENWHLAFLWPAANAVFVVYDLGLRQLIAIYLQRFVKK